MHLVTIVSHMKISTPRLLKPFIYKTWKAFIEYCSIAASLDSLFAILYIYLQVLLVNDITAKKKKEVVTHWIRTINRFPIYLHTELWVSKFFVAVDLAKPFVFLMEAGYHSKHFFAWEVNTLVHWALPYQFKKILVLYYCTCPIKYSSFIFEFGLAIKTYIYNFFWHGIVLVFFFLCYVI
jgi:hypothetical protein